MMRLAFCCLGESRREWAVAMQAEFEVAFAEGKPFAFAAGCLVTAWRQMPQFAEGRLVLANYALALGLLIPMAVLQFALALGLSSAFGGGEAFNGGILACASQNPILASPQIRAAACLLALWLLLGMSHLRLAWVLVDHDWERVAKVSAFIAAVLMTLFILTAVMVLDVTFVILQAAAMAIEFTVLMVAARLHARHFLNVAVEFPAR